MREDRQSGSKEGLGQMVHSLQFPEPRGAPVCPWSYPCDPSGQSKHKLMRQASWTRLLLRSAKLLPFSLIFGIFLLYIYFLLFEDGVLRLKELTGMVLELRMRVPIGRRKGL